jgi:hypothetical protein
MGYLQKLIGFAEHTKAVAARSNEAMLHCTMSFIIGGIVVMSTPLLCGAQK